MRVKINKIISAKALKLLNESPRRLKKSIGIGLFKIGNEMKDQAVNMAPYKSGHLRRSITLKKGRNEIRVGSNLVYARIHDQGGTIKPRTKKYLRFKIGKHWVCVKSVKIPKYKGRGYLTPAFERQIKGRAKKILESIILKAFY